MDVIVRRARSTGSSRGPDIYAISAPIVVGATQRVNDLCKTRGVVAAGEAFDAQDFWNSLSPEHLVVEIL